MPNARLAVFQPLTHGYLTHMYYQIVVRSEIYLNVFEVFFYRVLILQCKFRRTRDGKGDTSFFIDINEYAHDANGVINILLKLIYFTGNRVNY